MDDLSSVINSFLSKPENMEMVKNLTSMLGTSTTEEPAEKPAAAKAEQAAASALDGIDLKTIATVQRAVSAMSQDDEHTALLRAIRPYLSEERKTRLDESMKMMKLMNILPLLKEQGIL